MRLFLLTEPSVDALTRQTGSLFSLPFFWGVKFAEKYLGNLGAVSITIVFNEGEQKNPSSVLVFLHLPTTTRTVTAASRRRGHYKYNPPQIPAR